MLNLQKSKPKSTHHIICRGKQITQFESRIHAILLTVRSYKYILFSAMVQIQPGKVSTYGGIARALHSGPRCVGQTLRKNPFAPEVPCHRVVAALLDIGGFQEEAFVVKEGRSQLYKEKEGIAK
ncbi:hypothetical protein PsorP6_012170 [Peronosclerospora sorghi]|uniref:Uncharacterized protein n=1 Tax=Peronosclerospora sorghi TaxID=230839 RepID=A0ACC0WL45_9STRA|nr:hypothetical protein PsorP6_012170 [Peronosclerospora sorghi]